MSNLDVLTQKELFRKIGARYTMFVQLQVNEEDLSIIDSCNALVSDDLIIDLLINGLSWREQVLALFFICKRNIKIFYTSLFQGLQNTSVISIIPICAVITLCINEANCNYDVLMAYNLDRSCADGTIGYGLDKIAYHTGISDRNIVGCDPNCGQSFEKFYEFYKDLYRSREDSNKMYCP